MDVDDAIGHCVPIQGRVILHTTRDKSSSAFSMNTPVVNTIAPVLEKLSGRYSPVQSTILFQFIFYY